MASSSEQDLVLRSVSLFRKMFHSKVPLEPKHSSAFLEEKSIKLTGRCLKTEIMESFTVKVSHLTLARCNELSLELDGKIQGVIEECVAKHNEAKTKCEAVFEKRIKDLCDTTKGIMKEKLEVQGQGTNLEIVIERGLVFFENYNNGVNRAFFMEQKEKLKERLEKLKKEMLEEGKKVQAK